jgi:hypothetical protein
MGKIVLPVNIWVYGQCRADFNLYTIQPTQIFVTAMDFYSHHVYCLEAKFFNND